MNPLIISTVLGNVKQEVIIKEEYDDYDEVSELGNYNHNQQGIIHMDVSHILIFRGNEEMDTQCMRIFNLIFLTSSDRHLAGKK